jgi:uncharacterized protein YqgC (DUF456 family)
MTHAILYLLLIVFLIAGMAIVIVSLPGLWLMTLGAAIYAVLTHFAFIGPRTIIVLLAFSLLGEIVDLVAAGVGAKRAGGGRRGLIGAIIGGLVGAIFFSLPVPVIGTLAGVCIGTFFGALIGELTAGKEVAQSLRIGAAATVGRLGGTLTKLCLGGVMLIVTLWVGWPWRSVAAAPVPVSLPAPTVLTTTRGS